MTSTATDFRSDRTGLPATDGDTRQDDRQEAAGRGRPRRRSFRPVRWIGAVILVIVVLSIAPWGLLLPKIPISGQVIDHASSEPLAGARVRVGTSTLTTTTDTTGSFEFERVSPTETLYVQADGYQTGEATIWPPRGQRIRLIPEAFALIVRDAETNQPVAEALAVAEGARFQSAEPGRYQVQPARDGLTVAVSAPGYRDTAVRYRGGGEVVASLQPRITGAVVDGTTGQPIPGAFLTYETVSLTAGSDGIFELESRPTGPIRVLAPGYRRGEIDGSQGRTLVTRLEPLTVRALYLTYYGVGDRGLRQNVMTLADRTEVNAVVIDVKGDKGKLAYRSEVPLAEQIGANGEPTVPNVDELLTSLKQRGLYTIARISVFKDDPLARNGQRAGLDVAIRNRLNDQPWADAEGTAWVDPLQPAVWEYNIALAREAARKGFDEVQFDYLRFPTDTSAGLSSSQARYSRGFIEERDRVEAITGFLRRARDEVRLDGAFVSAEVYGYATWNNGDNGNGQDLVAMASAVDYLCPTVFPSSFRTGLPGIINFPAVVQRPYNVVFETLRRARGRTEGQGAVIRPWLQYFDDYPWQTGRSFQAADIDAQRQAAVAAGVSGWMMWDPSNRYARGGLGVHP